MTHKLKTSVTLPVEIEKTFAFFANASNLETIPPPELRFQILTPQPIEVTEGTEIDYRLCLCGLPLKWRARITNWTPSHRFVDEQIQGPYKQWVHIHRFHGHNGSTTIVDEVRYELPLCPFGELAYPIVSAQLQRIFDFRNKAIRETIFGSREEDNWLKQ
ncbi:MAG: SRPBCC family protein [Deltaproteobacteria bacterium]|nr:MAG: SRPBCC family protein [Deltaproteobacteria bacterium]